MNDDGRLMGNMAIEDTLEDMAEDYDEWLTKRKNDPMWCAQCGCRHDELYNDELYEVAELSILCPSNPSTVFDFLLLKDNS